jgi:hypothetical protein
MKKRSSLRKDNTMLPDTSIRADTKTDGFLFAYKIYNNILQLNKSILFLVKGDEQTEGKYHSSLLQK